MHSNAKALHPKWPTAQRTKNWSVNAQNGDTFLRDAPIHKVPSLVAKKIVRWLGLEPGSSSMRGKHGTIDPSQPDSSQIKENLAEGLWPSTWTCALGVISTTEEIFAR